jgi:hypothetical protein
MISPLLLSAISGACILVAAFLLVYNWCVRTCDENVVACEAKKEVAELRRLLCVNEAFNAEKTIDCTLFKLAFF